MGLNTERIEKLISSIEELIDLAKASERDHEELLKEVHPKLRASATNLVHYRAIRSVDLTSLQNKLGSLSISRLAQSQAHVLASLQATRSVLKSLIGKGPPRKRKSPVSIKKSNKLQRSNTKALLGYRSKGRRVRIMVTLPSEAATNYVLVHSLVESGMNSARINCAHDNPETWHAMIVNVRKASESLRRKVRVCMDLGGPKIRTGAMIPGPKVVTFAPDRDSLGKVVSPCPVWLTTPGSEEAANGHPFLPVSPEWLSNVAVGDVIRYRDTRDKSRSLTVVGEGEGGFWVHAFARSFVATGTTLHLNTMDGEQTDVLDLPAKSQKLLLSIGDLIVLHRLRRPDEPSRNGEDRQMSGLPHIACTNEEVFTWVAEGDRVMFDDGKIEGLVQSVEPGESLLISVTYAKPEGQKLAADKGINFPNSRLRLAGLTEKDRKDLAFVVEYADVVNMSFVNTAQDVEDLLEELDRLGGLQKTGVILKVETQSAFDNLTEILLAAMRAYPVGVMIARGDLAVECGWQNMPRIQQETQSICRAAHLPDVWATQVLENMAKKGLPSRAELTDAATAIGAECVMLNKGPHIQSAVQMLGSIFKDLRAYRHDKLPMLPALADSNQTNP